ncbi:hypothetical protein SESBI_25233 [Sesbania bispinosa]|nr:hypothetical protein SESBI_25233 [Sesbania bispinosa]
MTLGTLRTYSDLSYSYLRSRIREAQNKDHVLRNLKEEISKGEKKDFGIENSGEIMYKKERLWIPNDPNTKG